MYVFNSYNEKQYFYTEQFSLNKKTALERSSYGISHINALIAE